MSKGDANTSWQRSVRNLLCQGFGVEDIAQRLRCAPDTVRQEVAILRAEGKLAKMFGAWA